MDPNGYDNYREFRGFLGRDEFGRWYVDSCPDSSNHTTDCRIYLNEMLPVTALNKKVSIEIDIRIIPIEDVHGRA